MLFKESVKFYLDESSKKVEDFIIEKSKKKCSVENLESGRKISTDKDKRDKDMPSFMPSGINRISDNKDAGYEVLSDAELYADAICKRKNLPTIGSKWDLLKNKYIKAWKNNTLSELKKEFMNINA